MSHQFYIGQKVVCVDDAQAYHYIRVGQTYTVEAVTQCHGDRVTLREVKDDYDGRRICATCRRPLPVYGIAFYAHRFRPLDTLIDQIERIESEGAPVEHELQTA